jgi:hypothetical protein
VHSTQICDTRHYLLVVPCLPSTYHYVQGSFSVLHKFLAIPLLCTLGSPASQIEAASIVSGRTQPFQKRLVFGH